MKYRRFEPLDRELSQLVLGTTVYRDQPEDVSVELLDAWLELGGTIIDTGREYGMSERIVGRWLRERGLGDEIAILSKGAHQDEIRRRVTPADIAADLHESLAELGRDAIDLYLLHRDDPAVPVGPLVECLDEHRRAGLIRAFGASNWTTERLAEANAHAAAHGLEGFSCSSPSLNLARQNEPPWLDCLSAADPDSRTWYARTGLPLFAWSAQAAGFFAGSPSPDAARVYDSADNRERLRRATELARTRGCSAHHVALAWVLHQPFPTFAIIGPRTVDQLRDSVAALDVELTPDECRWLDLGEGP